MSNVRTRVYRDGILFEENFPVERVSECLGVPGSFVWVDLLEPSEELFQQLADELGLHELAVEDALGPHERSKLDRYPTHLFLSSHAVSVDSKGNLVDTEIDAFVNDHWIITIRKNDAFSMDAVLDRWDRSPDLARRGVSFFLYGLLDLVVDSYFQAVETFDAYYDEVSEGIFAEKPLDPTQERRWFEMRRAMVRFHRHVVPLREVVSRLLRREHSVVSEDLYPYFQDVYDHILRISESSESLRDLVGTIVETNISLRDYRQNQIVKKVSSWAAIIAVPALITGYYGMNVPYPGAGERWGVVASFALILGVSGGLWVLFRRRDWL